MSGMPELKSCPFCGGKAKISARQSIFHGQNYIGDKKITWTIYIKCNKCHARGKPIKTKPIIMSGKSGGNFYTTEYWQGSGYGNMASTLEFEEYVEAAAEAWNGRTTP